MQKRVSEEKLQRLRKTGIEEFARNGLENTNINEIARKAQVSVGTLYNYFGTKEDFFVACLETAVDDLEEALREAAEGDVPLLERADKIIRSLQSYSREHPEVNRLYNQITSSADLGLAARLAERIESVSSETYRKTIEAAADRGEIRSDEETRYLAFFFDDLMTTLQFSYSCPYYKERLRIFCGDEALEDDDLMREQLLGFLDAAFSPHSRRGQK